jgi:hypothetical protein
MTAGDCCSMTCTNGVCGQGLCSLPGQLCSMLQPCCPGSQCAPIMGQNFCL